MPKTKLTQDKASTPKQRGRPCKEGSLKWLLKEKAKLSTEYTLKIRLMLMLITMEMIMTSNTWIIYMTHIYLVRYKFIISYTLCSSCQRTKHMKHASFISFKYYKIKFSMCIKYWCKVQMGMIFIWSSSASQRAQSSTASQRIPS